VLVTGAGSARGIAHGPWLRLGAAGWTVAALDREEDAAKETAKRAAGVNGAHAVGWRAT